MTEYDYKGTGTITGTLTDSVGESGTFSGTTTDTLTADLDSTGTGTASGEVSGNFTLTYTDEDGNLQSEIDPIDVVVPTVPFSLTSFGVNETDPFSIDGVDVDVTVMGTVVAGGGMISENVSVVIDGTYEGVMFVGTINVASTLTLADPIVIAGTAANQATTDVSGISPFGNVTIADLLSPTETVTVRLSDAVNGTLSNLGAGTYDATLGVYTVSGTPAAVTAAVDGLVFNPSQRQAPIGQTVTTDFTINVADGAGKVLSDTTTSVVTTETTGPNVITLVTFNGSDGGRAAGNLIALGGNLFGTTSGPGGESGDGMVFEISDTGGVYLGNANELAAFNDSNGEHPNGNLIADAAGDLFGTTGSGGANGDGTVFEIAKTAGGYASSPTILETFTGANGANPSGGVFSNAAGDLFGTTVSGGANGDGTVFELAKTVGGYADATTLVSFDSANGKAPAAGVIADSAGDLFGVTAMGGSNFVGTVYEIVKTADGYASTPTTLASFDGADGAAPAGGLIADAAGDLFGTTNQGGTDDDGTLFEIAKTANGYASTPTILVNFTAPEGNDGPETSLLFDAARDIFGTAGGGVDDDGTVFELAKTDDGYATAPTILVNFDGTDGDRSAAGLIADANGDLFGTTIAGGAVPPGQALGHGTAFELTNTGFQVTAPPPPVLSGGSGGVSYAPGGAPVAVAATLGVADAASEILVGATVAIASGFLPGDMLNFADQSGIGGFYNAATGVLTLAGSASLAAYQTALQSISFSSTGSNLSESGADPIRTISLAVTDGTQYSNTIASTITLAVAGVGANFLTGGYFDNFVRGTGGQIMAQEYTSEGIFSRSQALTVPSGAAFTMGAAASVAGTAGVRLFANGLDNLFVVGLTGQLVDEGFTNAGVNDWTEPLTTLTGGAFTLNQTATVVGTAADFFDNGLNNLFVRAANGQVVDQGFTNSGADTWTQPLNAEPGVAFTLGPTETIVGTAPGLFGNGLDNLLVRHVDGQLVDEGFTDAGLDSWTQPLWEGTGTPITLDAAETVAGSALNFFGNGLENLFVVHDNGQLVDEGFTTGGMDVWTQPLMLAGATPFTIDPMESVAGTAFDFLGNGLSNLFVIHDNGQVVDEGFTAQGMDTWTQPLTQGAGIPFMIGQASSIVGTAENFLGNGLDTLFVRTVVGQVIAQGFSTAGVNDWTQPLTYAGGPAFKIAATDSVVGVGQNLLENGGYDLFLRSATGQLSDSEFVRAGFLLADTVFPALGDGDSGQVMIGSTGSDSLTASTGASTLIGDGGNDTYGFGSGATQAVIVNGTTGNTAASGTLNVNTVTSDTGIWLDRVDDNGAVSSTGNNLRIDILGMANSVTVDNWFAPGDVNAQLAEIALPGAAGGALKLDSGVSNLVQAMASFETSYATANGFAFDPTNPANAPITNATVLAAVTADWHH